MKVKLLSIYVVIVVIHNHLSSILLGGNQRELARAKNAKKHASMSKSKGSDEKSGNKGAGLEKRKERDADIMREKQRKAAEKKGS